MIKILIIEDDKAIRLSLEEDLVMEGYEVDIAVNGNHGLEMALKQAHDLILLDLMLPGMNGLEICKELRRKDIRTAVIMLTAKSQDIDKVLGLELGADDYITKPFNSRELRSRIKAVLRRTKSDPGKPANRIKLEPFEIDISRYEFRLHGEIVALTQLEFDLMAMLMRHPGVVLKRDDILNEVWGKEVYVTPRTIDAHIAKMRRKFKSSEDQDRIVCLRGVGYKFQES
jgi:two-component system alkaline phosphatase synthesis response regulator PhoP